ncbi:tyrosine-type recombinase/integrase [Bradyrhizobium cytisi]|uniref:Tyrosine-type recombinase/integrase n=1 Tax=Bradyrhizobium cytisi TaxID=515489 RepID=A0A5S4WNM5_9BRAD|nr:tyrosine-type recombinase/integrase [Bradyrhizobium cytisi]TYL83677.1 tyrosine-type recombinase/integrase [Bradyrhizobium cytisi]
MPRISKGPRLYKRKAKRRNGRLIASAVWTIRDGDREVATGIFAGEAERKPPKAAEDALVKYITSKYRPPRRVRDIEDIDVADVLAIYHAHREAIYIERGSPQSEITEFADRIGRLNDFFGGKMLAGVNAQTCGQYVKARGRPGGARRDLEDLRAAINHHAREGLHRGLVRVALPAKGPGRERWLSRSEAAALLWACWRYREIQTRHRGPLKNQKIETGKRPLRHIARFILIGLYTGTRAGAIASASPYRDTGRSYVDLENGIFYRLAQGRRPTKKRQPPAPIPDRLLAHMRRWARTGAIVSHFVEFNGAAVKSVKSGFRSAVGLAKLSTEAGKVTPHTLRHTAATWLMQRGADPWKSAGFLGMSVEVLLDTYGHHHPEFLREAAAAITTKPNKNVVSGVDRGVDLAAYRERRQKA